MSLSKVITGVHAQMVKTYFRLLLLGMNNIFDFVIIH